MQLSVSTLIGVENPTMAITDNIAGETPSLGNGEERANSYGDVLPPNQIESCD